jgi:hypothetical protein
LEGCEEVQSAKAKTHKQYVDKREKSKKKKEEETKTGCNEAAAARAGRTACSTGTSGPEQHAVRPPVGQGGDPGRVVRHWVGTFVLIFGKLLNESMFVFEFVVGSPHTQTSEPQNRLA